MTILPSAIIICNNDLTDNVRFRLTRQLFITDVMDGYTFDSNIAQDPDYAVLSKRRGKRILVLRSLEEVANRDEADVVLFVKAGLVSVQESKFGPPGDTFKVVNLYWTKLGL